MKKILLWSGSVLVGLLLVGYFLWNESISYALSSLANNVRPHMVLAQTEQSVQQWNNESKKQVEVNPVHTETAASATAPSEAPVLKEKESPKKVTVTPVAPQKTDVNQKKTAPTKEKSIKLKYEAKISPEKAQQVKQALSLEDKELVTSILLKKFSLSDIKLFMHLMKGGLSIEEKKEAKKIFLQKLTQDEYDRLIKIAAKLGVSQGESYQQSVKDFKN